MDSRVVWNISAPLAPSLRNCGPGLLSLIEESPDLRVAGLPKVQIPLADCTQGPRPDQADSIGSSFHCELISVITCLARIVMLELEASQLDTRSLDRGNTKGPTSSNLVSATSFGLTESTVRTDKWVQTTCRRFTARVCPASSSSETAPGQAWNGPIELGRRNRGPSWRPKPRS